ncbi:MerR family DNA-binding transcriptional regulator [Cnuibacter sp. UC19_7]|uniref:MerR family DNA-binding transcriptional regulator n=1 Tax=Cnuibacter sp. UC19_7 TaxID=3350166 RepID=UPI00366D161A
MLIGELSRRSGVSARSLRYYEQHGLIEAERGANGYREYDEAAVARARNLQLLFGLGISRELAGAVLACSGDAAPEVHRASRDQLAEVRDRMAERIAEMTVTHAALSRIVDEVG